MELVDRSIANGVRVRAWGFDALYGRNVPFLDGMEERKQTFVGEVPADFHGWVEKPQVLQKGPQSRRGRSKKYPRLARRRPSCEIQNLVSYSPVFREQSWQRYRIKDTDKGPEVWEVKWSEFWRKGENGLPGRRHCLIVARNVLTGDIKYFLANRVPGAPGVTLRWLLCVAFGRWSIESCFRQAKDELGLDQYQVRGWRCVRRHLFVTQLSHLFCARVRQKYDDPTGQLDRLTVEQVRSATNAWLAGDKMKPAERRDHYEDNLKEQRYYQRRNRQARRSHTKTRIKKLQALGIDVDRIKSCLPKQPQ